MKDCLIHITEHRIELNIEAILAQNLELKRQYEKLQKKYEQINMLD